MTAIELKKLLIHRIAEINDESFLYALDSKTQTQIITLTDTQREEIIESKNTIENGLFFELSQLDKEFHKWANA